MHKQRSIMCKTNMNGINMIAFLFRQACEMGSLNGWSGLSQPIRVM